MFSWQMGPTKMTTIVDYEAVKSLLMNDNKVGQRSQRTPLDIAHAIAQVFGA